MPVPPENHIARQSANTLEEGLTSAVSRAAARSGSPDWAARARLARQARKDYDLAALPALVLWLQQGNYRRRTLPESAGALFMSAIISGVVMLMRLLFGVVVLGLFGAVLVFVLAGVMDVAGNILGATAVSPWRRTVELIYGSLAVLGLVYLCRGWSKLGSHLMAREMHCGMGLLKLSPLLLGAAGLVFLLPIQRAENPFWSALLAGYAFALAGCFLWGMVADYDGFLIEAQFGEHSGNLYRLAFAIHAHAAVENITRLHRATAARGICRHCLVHLERITDQVINARYFRCRSCLRIYDGMMVLPKQTRLVAVLDQSWTQEEYWENEVLSVNALRRPALFDFEEVIIQDANDIVVESFVMKVENDTEENRRCRRRQIPCRIMATVCLSAHTLRLLSNTFGEVIQAEIDR